MYLIKWNGLNERGKAWDDTWEPAEYIEKDGAEELERFLEKRKAKKTSKNSSQDGKSSKKKEKVKEERKADPVKSSGDEAKSSSDEEEYELEEIKKYRVLR